MIFKLAFSNIRKSIKDYAVYFFTIVIGVAIFYLFNSIDEQQAYKKFIAHDPNHIGAIIRTTMRSLSVFVSVVLGLLIVYASRFLMHRRNREFAIYLMLGMGKRKVSAILFMETLLIGVFSLIVGLLLGIGLSQLMSALVANLFEADLDSYKFVLSARAAKSALIYFGIAYLVVILFNSFMISKCRILDLINSGKKEEKLKLKNPWACVIIFLISSAALGYAYHTVTRSLTMSSKELLLCIVLGAISTFFIFWSISGLVLKIIMSFKGGYYKGLNCFTVRQISSKLNTMVFSMTLICLFLFITICSLSVSFALRDALNKELRDCCQADMEIVMLNKNKLSEKARNRDKYINESPDELIEKAGLNDIFSGTSMINIYMQKNEEEDVIYYSELLGAYVDDYYKQSEFLFKIDNIDKSKPQIISINDFNKMWTLFGREPLTINKNEYFILSDLEYYYQFFDKAAEDGQEISFDGHKLTPAFDKTVYGAIDIISIHENAAILVVDDSVLEGREPALKAFHGNYKATGKEEKRAVDNEMQDKVKQYIRDNYSEDALGLSYFTTKLAISDMTIGIGAMATFIGLYLGLTFLITCAAIIALKQLSECADSVERYEMLRKIGAEENSISRSLLIQTGTFFLLPLILAIIHSIYGIKFAKPMMIGMFVSQNMIPSIIATAALIVAIYGGYFVITYFCGRSVIRNRRK
ncbi:MAG: ABC transporter permease [Ruminococcus sp.]|nr:ABC transporter permease [Ruminococcus sp.]